jgi:G3E family GTPase
VRATVVALNPSAKLHVTSYSKIDLSCVINTGLFSMEKAGQHAGWLKELRGEHVPETLEYGISSFVYRARRPFHVGRLHSLLETCFLFNSARPSDEAEAAAVLQLRLQAQARLDSSQPLAAPLRSKGFIWLSSMHLKVCEWAQAGAMISITPHGPWFVDVPLSSWPEEDAARAAIKADMQGAHGDRRQELVFIGQVAQPHVLARCISALGNLLQGVDEAAVRVSLDACLLTEEEFALQPAEWKGLCDDPFETSQVRCGCLHFYYICH